MLVHVYLHIYISILLHIYEYLLLLLPLSRVIIKQKKNRNRKSITRVYYEAPSSLEIAEMSLRCTCSKFFYILKFFSLSAVKLEYPVRVNF